MCRWFCGVLAKMYRPNRTRIGRWRLVVLTAGICAAQNLALAAPPDTLKVAIVTFLSGPAAAAFGTHARNAAMLVVDQINAGAVPAPYDQPGIAGAKFEAVFIDESGGATRQVTEFRNLVQRQNVDVVLGYVSSGDCLAIAPIAEELKTLLIAANCGTSRLFEEDRYRYVFRTIHHSVPDNIAVARYVHERFPAARRIAGINQNYAWGRDSWAEFVAALGQLQGDIEIVDEQWPKLFAGQFGAEISSLLVKQPDVIHSSMWGADLEAFISQAAGRGLFARSQVVLSAGGHILPRVSARLPDGTIIGDRGATGEFIEPGLLGDWYVAAYQGRFEETPIDISFAQALLGLKAAYEKAWRVNGAFPSTDQVISAFEYLSFPSPGGQVHMSLGDGHQAIAQTAVGRSRDDPELGKVTVTDIRYYSARCVNPLSSMSGRDWIGSGFPDAQCD